MSIFRVDTWPNVNYKGFYLVEVRHILCYHVSKIIKVLQNIYFLFSKVQGVKRISIQKSAKQKYVNNMQIVNRCFNIKVLEPEIRSVQCDILAKKNLSPLAKFMGCVMAS